MQHVTIRHRSTNAVLFELDVAADDPQPMRTALMTAVRCGREPDVLRAELEQTKNRISDGCTRETCACDKQLVAIIERELVVPSPAINLRDANLGSANLRYANLRSANLRSANLRYADLSAADLSSANLRYADLRDANLRYADLRYANLRGANLGGADLGDANLGGANLGDANLGDANLRSANLSSANLSSANLRYADLSAADLSSANLRYADLRDANLRYANLRYADLGAADLGDADLGDAYLRGSVGIDPAAPATPAPEVDPATRDVELAAKRREKALQYRAEHPGIPVIERLDAKILSTVDANPNALNMSTWHACETTHCRAGWSINLAGKEGAELERRFDSEDAGRRIYLASVGYVPNFFATNEAALADIRESARIHELAFPTK